MIWDQLCLRSSAGNNHHLTLSLSSEPRSAVTNNSKVEVWWSQPTWSQIIWVQLKSGSVISTLLSQLGLRSSGSNSILLIQLGLIWRHVQHTMFFFALKACSSIFSVDVPLNVCLSSYLVFFWSPLKAWLNLGLSSVLGLGSWVTHIILVSAGVGRQIAASLLWSPI